jgi:hypothetical protein
VADISRLRERFGYEPRYNAREALQAFLDEQGIKPLVGQPSLQRLERRALELTRAVTRGDEG